VLSGLSNFVGFTALVIAVVSWTIAPTIVSRASLEEKIDALAFNGWRMLVALLATFPLAVLVEGFPHSTPWLNAEFQTGVWVGGVVGSIVGDSLFIYSVTRVGASVALPASYLFILWTSLYDYYAGIAGSRVLIGAILAILGVIVVARSGGGRRGGDIHGIIAAVLASLVWATSMYAYQLALAKAGYLSVAEVRAMFMTIVLLPVMLRWVEGLKKLVTEVIVTGMLGYVIGALAFLKALELMPASTVAIGLALTPVLTQATASLYASEKLTPKLLLGGGLVSLGIGVAKIL
jgi:DME family drug/metabolite transporter